MPFTAFETGIHLSQIVAHTDSVSIYTDDDRARRDKYPLSCSMASCSFHYLTNNVNLSKISMKADSPFIVIIVINYHCHYLGGWM